jgi:hypothetical protein
MNSVVVLEGETGVRSGNYTAVQKGAFVNVWHDVHWCGQWHWVEGVGIADQDHRGAAPIHEVTGAVLGKLAHALREKDGNMTNSSNDNEGFDDRHPGETDEEFLVREEAEAEVAHAEERAKYKYTLALRVCRLKRQTELKAPDSILANEMRLITKAVLDIAPEDLIAVLEDFPNLYVKYREEQNRS